MYVYIYPGKICRIKLASYDTIKKMVQEMILVRYQVDGTTGTPLGGFGAGAVKFIAHEGSFAVMTHTADTYDYVKCRF